jgi:HD-like signal output (HDOD) protein
LFKKILEVCAEKNIPTQLVETLTNGINHAEIGAKIAEKWNFPDVLTSVIRYHHEPDMAPSDFKKLTSLVYFANLLCHYQEDKIEYYQFDSDVLELFHLSTEPQLKVLSDKLIQAFKMDSKNRG